MRVKTGVVRRKGHKKVLKLTKGMRMTKGRLFRASHEAMLHQGQYAFVGRKLRKRDLRSLWIMRINAGLSQIEGAPSYSRFINMLNLKQVKLDRKMLSEMAAVDFDSFKAVVSFCQQ